MNAQRITPYALHWLLFRPTFYSSGVGAVGIALILVPYARDQVFLAGSVIPALSVVLGVLALTTLLQIAYNHYFHLGPILDFFEADQDLQEWTPEQMGPLRNALVSFPFHISRFGVLMWLLAGVLSGGAFTAVFDFAFSDAAVVFFATAVGGCIAAPFHYGYLKRSMKNLRYMVSERAPALYDKEENLILKSETKISLSLMSAVIGSLMALATVSFGQFEKTLSDSYLQQSRSELRLISEVVRSLISVNANPVDLDHSFQAMRRGETDSYTFIYDRVLEDPIRQSWESELEEAINLSADDTMKEIKGGYGRLLEQGMIKTGAFIAVRQRIKGSDHLEVIRVRPAFTMMLLGRMKWVYVGFAFAAFLLAWLLGKLINNDITQPQMHLARLTQRVAAGDLREEAHLLSDDELGRFAFNMTMMIRNLKEMVGQIAGTHRQLAEIASGFQETSGVIVSGTHDHSRTIAQISQLVRQVTLESRKIAESADGLESASQENSDLIHSLESGLEGLSANTLQLIGLLDDTSKSVDRIAASINHVAKGVSSMSDATSESSEMVQHLESSLEDIRRSIQETAKLGKQVEADAESGRRNTATGSDSILQIAQKVESARHVISTLREKAEAIEGISSIINGIAEKTNLLALNASISASQAGEHGSGFAVIAEEIRNLSNNTQTSAHGISELIGDIHSKMSDAESIINLATEEAESGVQLAELSERGLAKIIDSARQATQMTEKIEAQMGEQAASNQRFIQRVESMVARSTEIDKSTAGVRKQATAIQEHYRRMTDIAKATQQSLKSQTHGSVLMNGSVKQINDRVHNIHELLKYLVQNNDRISSELEKLVEIAEQFERRAGTLEAGFNRLSGASGSLRRAVENFRV